MCGGNGGAMAVGRAACPSCCCCSCCCCCFAGCGFPCRFCVCCLGQFKATAQPARSVQCKQDVAQAGKLVSKPRNLTTQARVALPNCLCKCFLALLLLAHGSAVSDSCGPVECAHVLLPVGRQLVHGPIPPPASPPSPLAWALPLPALGVCVLCGAGQRQSLVTSKGRPPVTDIA